MVDVRRVTLPGVGVLHSITTTEGAEIAVVAHRTGSSDLVSRPAGARDDDEAITVRLDEDEAREALEVERYLQRVAAERESQLQPDDESADRVRLEAPDIVKVD